MAFENLLRPGYINTMYMRNRLIVGPMEKSLANLDGTLNLNPPVGFGLVVGGLT